MLGTVIHLMRGTPYIYQGEEIGMTNAYFEDISEYRDVESVNAFYSLKDKGLKDEEVYHILQERSRDNSRTPMQWNDSKNAGFSEEKPWISVQKNYKDINVEKALHDPNSIFYHYQKLIALRKKYKVIQDGIYRPMLEEDEHIFVYERYLDDESMIVINNFFEGEYEIELDIEDYEVLLSNYEETNISNKLIIRPYESLVLYKKD